MSLVPPNILGMGVFLMDVLRWFIRNAPRRMQFGVCCWKKLERCRTIFTCTIVYRVERGRDKHLLPRYDPTALCDATAPTQSPGINFVR